MKKVSLFFLLTTLILFSACGSSNKESVDVSGGKSASILVYMDSSANAGDETKQKQYDQIMSYMGPRLVKLLKKAGYNAELASSKENFKGDTDRYLLDVKITKYNPGSKAARIVVGFGAGTCSLDMKYDVIGANSKIVYSDQAGCASSRDWYFCANKNSKTIVDALKANLR